MTKEQIVEKIQKLREENGYTMNKLAKLAGTGYSNYYRIETKKTDMNVQTLHKICDALGISMSDFFNESVEHIPDKQKQYIISYLAPNDRTITRRVFEDDIETIIKYIQSTSCEIIAISEIDDKIKRLLEK